jgi:DNA-binding NarL/FixJ family response regulator
MEIMRIRPEISIIMCTAFSSEINPATAQQMDIDEFVLKPIVTGALADAVQRVLKNQKIKKSAQWPIS